LRISRVLRVAVAVGLTAAFLWRADPGRVFSAARGADSRWILGAVALVVVDRALMAYRWVALLVALTPASRPPLVEVLRIFFVSTFVGSFLPSVGGDLYRAYSLTKLRVSAAESTASVLMDRVLGVLAIVSVGAVALPILGPEWRGLSVGIALVAGATACAGVAVAVFSERAVRGAQALTRRFGRPRLQHLTAELLAAIRRYAGHRRALISVLVLSIAVQAIRVLQAWCLGRALDISAPLGLYFLFIPVILLIMLLPVTINGLGTGQVAFDMLFTRIGVSPAHSFALSVLFIALGFVGNLPGGLLYAFSPQRTTRDIKT
jgi:hypothetical protein